MSFRRLDDPDNLIVCKCGATYSIKLKMCPRCSAENPERVREGEFR